MSARTMNFGISQRERARRVAGLLDDPYDVTGVSAISDPAGNAFYGSLRELGQRAAENGMGFRADIGSIGRLGLPTEGGGRLTDTDRAGIAGNVALGRLTDEAHQAEIARRVGNAAASQAEGAQSDALVGSLQRSDMENALANASRVDTSTPEGRQEFLARLPPASPARAAYEKQFAAQEAEAAKQAETERQHRATEAAATPFASVTDEKGQPLMGPAVLEKLPPPIAATVKAVLDGRQMLPTGTATKDPYWKGIITLANQADPSFDAVDYNARAKTRSDFTSGKAAGQVNAINTVIGHLHDLADTGNKLGNTGLDWVNSIYNKLTPGGTDRGVTINNFETLKEGVANELMRVWRQVGAGSEKEIEDWKATIGASKSPQELKGAFKTIGGMLESKLGALDTQYKQGMGTDDVSAISPESRARLDALQGLAGVSGKTVKMVSPDGRTTRDVPADQVDHYLSMGAKRAG